MEGKRNIESIKVKKETPLYGTFLKFIQVTIVGIVRFYVL